MSDDDKPEVHYHPRHRAEPISRRPMAPEPEPEQEYTPKRRAGDPPKEHHEINVAPSKHWLRPAFLRRHPTILLTMLLIVAAIVTMFALALWGPR